MAVAAARHLGVSFADISAALAHFAGVCGRMERVPAADQLSVSVFIDYAHTPDALEKLLLCAKGFRAEGQRILLLFGCGGNRDPKKRPIMGRIAATHADHVYLTADNCRGERVEDILSDIQEGIPAGSSVSVIPDRKQAIYQALLDAKEGDILLLAGKGHEKYEIDQNGKHFFDERAVVQEAVEARINQ
jgi:UDP-N-acetylmuramyl-tripeptide synthetase